MTNEKELSANKWHTCPNENEKPECQKILEEIIDELLFIEQLNLKYGFDSKWGKKVD